MRTLVGLVVIVLLTSCAIIKKNSKKSQNFDGIIFLEESDDDKPEKKPKSSRNDSDRSSNDNSKNGPQKENPNDERNFTEMEGIVYLNFEDQINERAEQPFKPNHQKLETGKASYYAMKFKGRQTASGEIYDPDKLTAAHPSLPFGTKVRVTNLYNKASVVVRINDRGPHVKSRIIDLSYAAAEQLGMISRGIAEVAVEVIENP
jgi:rare lipoprotein A